MKRRFIFSICLMVVMAFAAVVPVLATENDDDEICQKDNLDYTNASAGDETIYATVYDTSDNEIISSKEVTTLSPGESFDDDVSFDAENDDDIIVLYSTTAITDPNNLAYFASGSPDPCKLFQDGRLNEYDVAAPATVYNIANQFIDVYAINESNGQGTRALRIPYIQVLNSLEVATTSGENQLIQENGHIAVYALSSGTCQMNAFGARYVFEWNCLIN